MNEKRTLNGQTALNILTWLFRVLTGGTFIFSGFVKAIDPWGSLYKFEEYISAMGIPMLHSLLITGVFALCAFEFILGVAILLGCYRRSAPLLSLAMMCVMLPLTLWIAVSDPVSDCGCFGDFVLISNWSSFWKNILLTAMSIWLIKFNRNCITIISPAFQWLGVVISLAFILSVTFTGYMFQPLLDFRPYVCGSQLLTSSDEAPDSDFVFVYEKDGATREFSIDDELPDDDSGWTFVERRELNAGSGDASTASEEKTFRLWSRDGNSDVTEDALSGEGKEVVLLIPRMKDVSPATTWKINALHDWITEQGGSMIAVTDGTSEQIASWEEMALPDYDIYTADDTAIKKVARGNPAVVMLDNGKIIWKSTLTSIDADLMEENGPDYSPSTIITEPVLTLRRLIYIYLICMGVPVALSFMPRIKNVYTRRESGERNPHS